jgi:hypothetical protein
MAHWESKLSRIIELRDGTKLATLTDARAFILELPEADQQRSAWYIAVVQLLAAAEEGGSIEDATYAIERALFFDAKLKLR